MQFLSETRNATYWRISKCCISYSTHLYLLTCDICLAELDRDRDASTARRCEAQPRITWSMLTQRWLPTRRIAVHVWRTEQFSERKGLGILQRAEYSECTWLHRCHWSARLQTPGEFSPNNSSHLFSQHVINLQIDFYSKRPHYNNMFLNGMNSPGLASTAYTSYVSLWWLSLTLFFKNRPQN